MSGAGANGAGSSRGEPGDAASGLPTEAELAALDDQVEDALAAGHESTLDLLGYGEISCVLALDAGAGRFACKRLPRFDSRERLDAYRGLLAEYLAALSRAGLDVLDSHILEVDRGGPDVIAYCVQPRLPSEALATSILGRAEPAAGSDLLERVAAAIRGVISPEVGLDAQLSNWALLEDRLIYLDVTTPLLRDQRGRDRLDRDLFVASLPWALRGPVKALVLHSVTSHYHDLRTAFLDLAANLHKERLAGWIEPFLALCNAGLARAITPREVARYYRSDARLWAALQRLRRLDRAWQRRVRRRTYPFVLPGAIAR